MSKIQGASVRLIHNPERAQIETLLTTLVSRGCNAVAIIPHHYTFLQGWAELSPPRPEWMIPWFIYPDVGQDDLHPFHNTPDPALTYFTCKLAQKLGLHVLLKPHVDSYYGAWRGYISVIKRPFDWVFAYRQRFLAQYISIAQALGLDLCMGCELYTVTKELGPKFWIETAEWVRGQGFKGALTYAANWGIEQDAEYNRLASLWPNLDYIGVDAYFPLIPEKYPNPITLDLLLGKGDPENVGWHRRVYPADWAPHIDEDLIALRKAAGKRPLVFTEIGYPNADSALVNPGGDPDPRSKPNELIQAWAIAAFADRWQTNDILAGYYWWEAMIDRNAVPAVSDDILGKPVDQIVWNRSVQ